jgi:hypothetical protein
MTKGKLSDPLPIGIRHLEFFSHSSLWFSHLELGCGEFSRQPPPSAW